MEWNIWKHRSVVFLAFCDTMDRDMNIAGEQEAHTETEGTPRSHLLGRFLKFLEPKLQSMKDMGTVAKDSMSQIMADGHLQELRKKDQDIALRDLVLSLLATAEFVPVAEMANEGSKGAAILQRVTEIFEKEGKPGGKLAKFMPDLYPNIPKSLLTVCTTLDAAGIPFIGVLPELLQLGIDRIEQVKLHIQMDKESGKIIWENFKRMRAQNQPAINTARAVFAGGAA